MMARAFSSSLARRSAWALLIGIACSGAAVAQEVWVITDSKQPLQGAHQPARVIELDAARRIQANLSANLPADPQQAASIVRQRLKDGGTRLQQQMQTAYQGVADSWSMGVTTIPAVVVDRRYVIYGETDIDRAIARIAQYRKEHP
jgi:integrating conjugative element protein (TIGR03757 family)